jgi:uncharacterized protein (UPF0212 family)
MMTIDKAIAQLETIKSRHGNVEVYFDCPKCGQSFTPNVLVTLAVHITEKKNE